MPEQHDHNKYFYVSVSKIDDANGCDRRRWFAKVCKLPQNQSSPTVFGDIGHDCCERFHKADDQGRDEKRSNNRYGG